MAIIKCKMCGGDLIITEGSTVCECEYCGTMQTIPCMDDEKNSFYLSVQNVCVKHVNSIPYFTSNSQAEWDEFWYN